MSRQQKLHLLLQIVIAFSFSLTTLAQEDSEKGQIITIEGDTLKGVLAFDDQRRAPSEIFFRSPEGEIRILKPIEVKEISTPTRKYISQVVTIDTTPLRVMERRRIPPTSKEELVLLRVLVEGELSLYQYRGSSRDNFYIEEQGRIIELISREFVVPYRGRLTLFDTEREKYIDQLDELNTDCTSISKRRLDYSAENLSWFVSNCNLAREEGGLNIKLENEVPNFKINPYLGAAINSIEHRIINGNSLQDSIITTGSKSFSFGLTLMFLLSGESTKKAINLSLDHSFHNVEDKVRFADFSATNIKLGYLTYKESTKPTLYYSGGAFVGLRNSRYYRWIENEWVVAGLNIETGINHRQFRVGINANYAYKRSAEVSQASIGVVGGLSF